MNYLHKGRSSQLRWGGQPAELRVRVAYFPYASSPLVRGSPMAVAGFTLSVCGWVLIWLFPFAFACWLLVAGFWFLVSGNSVLLHRPTRGCLSRPVPFAARQSGHHHLDAASHLHRHLGCRQLRLSSSAAIQAVIGCR